jgi:SAM-dependent methyltransferase
MLLRRLPPVLRALLAQALGFLVILALARLGQRFPALVWVLLQATLAVWLSRGLHLEPRWLLLQAVLPFLGWLLWGAAVPAWLYLGGFLALALVFGGGLVTRVPLYLASRDACDQLGALLPEGPVRFVDLGCGLGGPVARLARTHPDGQFLGVEASPLSWFVAWLRCLPLPNARIRLGSLWRVDLAGVDVAYAFLSPVPMPALWAKALREMKPGSRLISHSFEIPGQPPDRVVPVRGRPGARLLVWNLP